MELKIRAITGALLLRRMVQILFAFMLTPGTAQVTFTEAPENLQLYPRDSGNKAKVTVSGKLLRKNYTRAILEISEEKKLVNTLTADFAATDSVSFNFQAEITAKPAEYDFKVVLLDKDQKKETVLEREGIVCGDFIILYGQSNIKALVGIDDLVKQTDTRLLRNYDTPDSQNPDAMKWYRADQPYASVGVIGLHLQSLILARYGIPTCVLNGSVGGANLVSLINPDESFSHLNSYYGQLYMRVKKAGALGKAKAIIWRQGEAETCNWYKDIEDYPKHFEQLYKQISKDYKGYTRFYNIQTGIQYCNQMEDAGKLREYMRNTKYLFEGIETTNMHDLPLSDDVHYTLDGYKKAAEELLPLLGRDIYGETDNHEVHPPDIQKIMITPSRDTLILVFEEDQKIQFPEPRTVNGFTWRMEDYLYVNTTTAYTDDIVVKAWADRNRVYIRLKWGINEGYVSYLPSYSQFNPPYQGVHLKNSRGLRAMAFYQLPVADVLKKPEIVSGEITGNNRIRLVFRESDRYVLERRLSTGQNFSPVASLNAGSYDDILASAPSDAVEYRIKRVSEKSESEYSDIIRVAVKVAPLPPVITSVSPHVILSGSGELISLKGQHLGEAPGKLEVGAQTAEVQSWNETEVLFRIPTVTVAGEHVLSLITSDGLKAESRLTVDPLLSEALQLRSSVYPNPFGSDDVSLRLSGEIKKVNAVSESGREIRLPFTLAGPEEWRIRAGELPAGAYILRVQTSGGELSVRTVKL